MASFVAETQATAARRSYVTLRTAEGVVVCERCFVADRPLSRMKGLLGRSELPADEGILIRPCGSVHTFFMRFAIDVVFLDRDWKVLKVTTVKPWRTAVARGARAVVELAAGEADRRGLRPGTRLQLEESAGSR